LKSEIGKWRKVELQSKQTLLILEIEEDHQIRKLTLKEGQICWEGFRKIGNKLVRGVPKRNREDCFKYCYHEGCQFT